MQHQNLSPRSTADPALSLALQGLFIAMFVVTSSSVSAQTTPSAPSMTAEQFLESLSPRTGQIELPGDVAGLNLTDAYYYLSPADTERVLTKAWGNPNGGGTLGMILPRESTVFDQSSWAVIVSYEEDGHVEDDDAGDIDFRELLESMQADTETGNESRLEAGYAPITLVGWATQPHYDAISKKLYWAKELNFGGQTDNTLNYNVRMLGRKGVLVLNVVAGMAQLQTVKAATPTILALADFSPGNQYADFDPDLDQVAAYGIGALIAGKLAAKVGLLAKLGVLLLVLKKFWIVGLVAIAAVISRFFRKKKT